MIVIATPGLQCHRVTLVSIHAPAIRTINVTTIAVAHSTSTHSLLLIATQLAHAGGLRPGSPRSAATEQRHCNAAMGKVGLPRVEHACIMISWCLEVLASRSLELKQVSCQSSLGISSLAI